MTERLAARGIMVNQYKWDDGPDHDDVTKIYVGLGDEGIRYIYCDYVKSGIQKEGSFHGMMYRCTCTQMFEIDHLRNEHLESIDGYYAEPVGITALQFKTNFRTSELFGFEEEGTKFTLAVKGKKIIGLHGYASMHVNSLGAYLTWITPIKLDEKGGKGGKKWDDGSDHDNVSKIHVRGGFEGIQFIKFDYVKDRKVLENGSTHGVSSRGFTQTFEINHRNDEYLVSVEGYYDDVSGVIQGLQFQTNMQTFDIMGYEKGRKFTLEANGYKIIGFHGYAEKNLNSLGVYFTTQTPNKLKCQGLTKGILWDDGSNNDGIRKVYVDDLGEWKIGRIRLEYVNNGKVKKTHRRYYAENEKEFVLDYPNELITSVEGTLSNYSDTDIRSLTLKTSKGRTISFGRKSDDATKFVLEKKGSAIVGFYGWAGTANLNALGAYYRPFPTPPDENLLEAKGGDGGASWDDGGSFDGVRRIYIGLSQNSVSFIKFMYYKNDQLVFGEDHGNKTKIGVQEFELNYPSEYITTVEGTYDTKSGVITMLRFKTNKQTSPPFGLVTTSGFILQKADHKIVGFHGKSSNMLHQIGVHLSLII